MSRFRILDGLNPGQRAITSDTIGTVAVGGTVAQSAVLNEAMAQKIYNRVPQIPPGAYKHWRLIPTVNAVGGVNYGWHMGEWQVFDAADVNIALTAMPSAQYSGSTVPLLNDGNTDGWYGGSYSDHPNFSPIGHWIQYTFVGPVKPVRMRLYNFNTMDRHCLQYDIMASANDVDWTLITHVVLDNVRIQDFNIPA